MSAVSPSLAPDWPASADGSPVVSPEALQATTPVQWLSMIEIDRGLNKIASLMRGDTRVATQAAAELAAQWLPALCERASKLGGWSAPHISSTEAGEIVFEWWRGSRNLTLYFTDEGAEYLEVWGTDIENEMRSGPLNNWSFTGAWLSLQS